jgi:hypothetical protein
MSRFLILGLAALAACDDSNSPNEAIAGTYHATSLVFTPAGSGPVDVLALGGSMEVVLTAQGTTTGTLVIPAVFTEDGVDEDVISLEGTYTRTGSTLGFQQEGDSFVRDVVWTVGSGTITTTYVDPEGTVQVTLTRS